MVCLVVVFCVCYVWFGSGAALIWFGLGAWCFDVVRLLFTLGLVMAWVFASGHFLLVLFDYV